MLKEGINKITLEEINSDEEKYIFELEFTFCTYYLDKIPTTPEEMIKEYNKYSESIGAFTKLVKVLTMADSESNWPVIRVQTTKPMTPKQYLDTLSKIFECDAFVKMILMLLKFVINTKGGLFKMSNESKNLIRRMGSRSKSDIVKRKIKNGLVEHNSFLEPITSEMCRTSKSIPRKGYTSVSRIATG